MSLTVKPLVWKQRGLLLWTAQHVNLRAAQVRLQSDGRYFLDLDVRRGDFYTAPNEVELYPTLEAAQAAAQVEWADFIRAAIQETS